MLKQNDFLFDSAHVLACWFQRFFIMAQEGQNDCHNESTSCATLFVSWTVMICKSCFHPICELSVNIAKSHESGLFTCCSCGSLTARHKICGKPCLTHLSFCVAFPLSQTKKLGFANQRKFCASSASFGAFHCERSWSKIVCFNVQSSTEHQVTL